MDQFQQTFIHIAESKVVICIPCRSNVTKKTIRTHLNSAHAYWTTATRASLIEIFEGLDDVAEKAEQIVFPDPKTKPFSCLPLHTDGKKCIATDEAGRQCGYIQRRDQHIREHCTREHGWINPRKRGRVPKATRSTHQTMWADDVCCQQFGRVGAFQRLFEVGRVPADQGTDSVQSSIVRAFTVAGASMKKMEKDQSAMVTPLSIRTTQSWVRRAGWGKHLKGFDRSWLASRLLKPGPKERGLKKVCLAMECMVWKAHQACHADVVGSASMNYINRREVGAETNESPISAFQLPSTMRQYVRTVNQVLCYVWRTHALREASTADVDAGADAQEKEDARDVGITGKRPSYRLSAEQKRRIAAVIAVTDDVGTRSDDEGDDSSESEGSTDDEESLDGRGARDELLEDKVLELFLSLLDHEITAGDYQSGFLSAMAVIGIDVDLAWKSPLGYTREMSGIITVTRMLVLHHATRTRAKAIERLMDERALSLEEAEMEALTHFDVTQSAVHKFMTLISYGGKPTPFDWMLRLRTYGQAIRSNTKAEGGIQWEGERVIWGNTRFTMSALRSMVHGLVESVRNRMLTKLLLLEVDEQGGQVLEGTTPLPSIPWSALVDNEANREPGWSFLKDPANSFGGLCGATWLSKRITSDQRLREEFVNVPETRVSIAGGGAVVWDDGRAAVYGRSMRTVRRDLAVLVQFTGGGPGRASELTQIRHKNSVEGELRGIIIEDGLVVVVSRQDKTTIRTGKDKVIHRYLPREVGELMLYYLWLALPFWEKLRYAATGGEGEHWNSSFIWEPKPDEQWEDPRVTRRRQKQEKRRRTIKEGVITRNNSNDSANASEEEEEEDGEMVEDRAGNDTKGIWTPELWETTRLSRAVERAAVLLMGVKLTSKPWRHVCKGIFNRYISDIAVLRMLNHIVDEGDETAETTAADGQFGHSSDMAENMYGRSITESPFTTQANRAGFRRVSLEWHRFLLFPSATKKAPANGTAAALRAKQTREAEARRWDELRQVNLQDQLERLVGDEAQFRSVQRPALEAIMQQKSPVVVIMPTSAGKSMLFMLPASCSDGVSVIITPLVSLQENMGTRCEKAGITCASWNSRVPPDWASLVFVTPESAVAEGFANFLNRLRETGRLDRIVFDECHVALDAVRGWRKKMLLLRNLVRLETQLVYLTATLRPKDEENFISIMGLPPKEDSVWIRAPTTRTNVAYRIVRFDLAKEVLEEAIARVVEEKKAQYPLPGQVIIYSGTVQQTQDLAAVLGCTSYYRAVGTGREKSAIVQRLTESQEQVFTATNALGLGVDAPHIRVVIHVGIVRELKSYAQESGRAGRDGERSEAILLRGVVRRRDGSENDVALRPRAVEDDMREFIEARGCMRVVLDREMDGRMDRERCEEGEERCEWCEARHVEEQVATVDTGVGTSMTDERRRRRSLSIQEERYQARLGYEEERFQDIIEIWAGGCPYCRVQGKVEEVVRSHTLKDCGEERATEVQEGVESLRRHIKWEKYVGCERCGLPQSMCSRFVANGENGFIVRSEKAACQRPEVVMQTIIAHWVHLEDNFTAWVEALMEGDGWKWEREKEGMEKVGNWMGGKKVWGRMESNRLCWMLFKAVD